MIAITIGSASRDFASFVEDTNLRVTFVDLWDLLLSTQVEYSTSGECWTSVKFTFSEIESADVVFYHPIAWEILSFSPLPSSLPDSTFSFAKRQLLAVAEAFEDWLERRVAVANVPRRSRFASNKLVQLQRFSEALGDCLIPTTLTSDYTSLQVGDVIKHASESRVINDSLSSFSHVLDAEKIQLLRSHEPLPLLRQTLVVADQEFRAYVFGSHVSVISFQRGNLCGGMADIHTDSSALDGAKIVELSPPHKRMIIGIVQSFQLNYAALDFFLDGERLKILELNPLPSWHWLPSAARRHVNDSLACFVRTFVC